MHQYIYQTLRPRRKKTVLHMKRFQKAVGRPAQFFFFNFCFYILLPKLPPKKLKNLIFFLLRSQFFIQIFVQKTADFTIFFIKIKNQQMGKKEAGRACRTRFLFSWPYSIISNSLHKKFVITFVFSIQCRELGINILAHYVKNLFLYFVC